MDISVEEMITRWEINPLGIILILFDILTNGKGCVSIVEPATLKASAP